MPWDLGIASIQRQSCFRSLPQSRPAARWAITISYFSKVNPTTIATTVCSDQSFESGLGHSPDSLEGTELGSLFEAPGGGSTTVFLLGMIGVVRLVAGARYSAEASFAGKRSQVARMA